MNEINYYRATIADIDEVIEHRIQFHTEFWGPQPVELINELTRYLRIYLQVALVDNSYIAWLAKCDDTLAGGGGVVMRESPGNFKNPSGKVGYLMNMYTIPEHRKKGICGTILNKLILSANEIGIYAFELHASKAGEPVYVKNGFEIHNEPTYRRFDKNL